MNGILNTEDFTRIYQDANNNKQNLQHRIKELKKHGEKEEVVVDLNKIVKEFVEMKEINRTMLVQLLDRITISENKEITIFYKFNVLNNIRNKKISIMKAC